MRKGWLARISLCDVAILLLLMLAGCTSPLKPPFDPLRSYASIKKTEPGLLEYKAKCVKRLESMDKRFPAEDKVFVTATFTRYLSKEEVGRLEKEHQLKIHLIMSRSIEKDTGLRGTIGEKSYKGKHRRDFIGFIEVVAEIPNARLKDLATDRHVFLVDPSADSHFVSNPEKDYMPGVFWALEDLGMLAHGTSTLSMQANVKVPGVAPPRANNSHPAGLNLKP